MHLRAEAATCRQISEAEERAARKRRAARAQLAQRKASDRDFAIALGGEFRKMGNHLAAADLRAARYAFAHSLPSYIWYRQTNSSLITSVKGLDKKLKTTWHLRAEGRYAKIKLIKS